MVNQHQLQIHRKILEANNNSHYFRGSFTNKATSESMVECVKTREIRNAMMKGETLASCSIIQVPVLVENLTHSSLTESLQLWPSAGSNSGIRRCGRIMLGKLFSLACPTFGDCPQLDFPRLRIAEMTLGGSELGTDNIKLSCIIVSSY